MSLTHFGREEKPPTASGGFEESIMDTNNTQSESQETPNHQANWRAAHPEKVAAYQKKWRLANPEAVKTAHTKYQEKHPEKVALWHKRSQLKKRVRELVGSITLQGGIATPEQEQKMGELQDQLIAIEEGLKTAK